MLHRGCYYRNVGPNRNLVSGTLIFIGPHSFEDKQPVICGVVETRQGQLIIVPITDVTFCVPGNEDKR